MIVVDYLNPRQLSVTFPYDAKLVAIIQELPDRLWDKKAKFWKMSILDLFILIKILKQNNVPAKITTKAKEKYIELISKFEENAEFGKLTNVEYEARDLEVKFYNFQKVGISFANKIEDAVIGLDMGLGKSVQALAVSSDALIDFGFKKNLIIVPASLKYNWAIEIAKFSKYSYTIVGGDAKSRKKLYHNKNMFTIVNYDLIWRDWELFKDIEWDLVIADEIQKIKNHKTNAHKTIKKIICKRKIGLTGTVIENGLMDLFSVMKWANPFIFGTNVLAFKNRYCEMDGWGTITGYKNLDEIQKKLGYVLFRRRKRDVLDDLPEKIIKNIYIDFNEAERKVYNEVKKGILEDIRSGTIRKVDILSRIIYLRQVCDCLNLVQEQPKIVSSKLNELLEILEELSDSKVVIFSCYERMTKILQDNLPYKFVRLHGGVKNDCRWEKEIEKEAKSEVKDMPEAQKDMFIFNKKSQAICKNCKYFNDDNECMTRKKITAKFNDDPEIKGIISTDAGKEGNNWQAADVLINVEESFNPATNEQRIARIDRIGQKNKKILVINLIIRNSIDEHVKEISADKQALFDLVIDNIEVANVQVAKNDVDFDNLENLL